MEPCRTLPGSRAVAGLRTRYPAPRRSPGPLLRSQVAALTAHAPVPVTSPAVLRDCSTSWSWGGEGGRRKGSRLRSPQPALSRRASPPRLPQCRCPGSSPPVCRGGLGDARAGRACRRSLGERVPRPSRCGLVSAASVEPAGAEAEVPGGEAARTGDPAGYGRLYGEGLRGARVPGWRGRAPAHLRAEGC